MSTKNVELMRSMLDAFNRGDPAALQMIDPQIEVEAAVGIPGVEGTYRGHAGLMRVLTGFWESFENPSAEIDEYIPVGTDDVVMAVRVIGRGKASGAEVDLPHGQVVTLGEGKVVSWRIFATTAQALEAAGMSE